jgi:hypothetical protein
MMMLFFYKAPAARPNERARPALYDTMSDSSWSDDRLANLRMIWRGKKHRNLAPSARLFLFFPQQETGIIGALIGAF